MAINLTNAQRFARLSEAEFREEVLIPLLKAMGYCDVDHAHGPRELGKDIVAWQTDSDGTREYVAMVAKVGKVNASATGDAATVATQVRQAFGATYQDKTTGEERRIHRVIVASTDAIKEQSQTAILSQLDEYQRRHVRFWDGEKVAVLFTQYLPERSVPETLEDVRQTLQSLENFTIVTEVHPEGISHRIESKKGSGVVIAKGELVFPNTHEGNQARETFQRFVDEGGKITIPGDYIRSFEHHEELARIFGNPKPASITAVPRASNPRPVRLEVDSVSGPLAYDGLALRLVQSGQLRSEFRTDDNEPLSAIIVFNEAPDQMGISCTFQLKLQGKKVHRARQAVRIWGALASGASFTLLDVETNIPLLSEKVLPESPPGEILHYLDNLSYIEDRLGWVLTLPDAITERDLLDAEELRHILECGSYVRPFETYSMTFTPNDKTGFLANFPANEPRWLKLEQTEIQYELLDRTLDLGVGVTVLRVILSTVERQHVADQVQQRADSINITFHPAPESAGMRSYFPRYLQGEMRERFEKIHGKMNDEIHS